MKVSLITLHTVSNYGSCLQAYASETVFRKFGCQVEIVDYYRKNNQLNSKVDRVFTTGSLSRFSPVWEAAPWLRKGLSKPVAMHLKRQDRRFDEFRQRYLHLSKRYLDAGQLKEDPPIADVYCTGSDQVWNSIWNEGFEGPYFLDFAPKGKRRIAYAASIGREELDDWEKQPMRDALAKYDAISLRESSGVKLVKGLGFPNVQLVLDPTLMLNREEWAKIATLPRKVKQPYVLVYQLNDNANMQSYARSVARKIGANLVKISYRSSDAMKSAINVIEPPVTDFLGLFLHASYVVTDSFHATAFALNFGCQFTAVAPPRFSTRINSVLELTGTEDRLLADYRDISMVGEPIDSARAQSALEGKRAESLAFLKRALS